MVCMCAHNVDLLQGDLLVYTMALLWSSCYLRQGCEVQGDQGRGRAW